MKLTTLSLLFTIYVLPVFSQVSVGVTGGYNHANLRVSDRFFIPDPMGIFPNAEFKNKYAPNWHAGLMADIPLLKGFYLQPQLLVSTKGNKQEVKTESPVQVKGTNKTHLIYLELPVNLVYKIPLIRGKLIVGAGAYFAKPLYGKYDDNHVRRDASGVITTAYTNQGKILFENEQPDPAKGMYYYKKHDEGLNFLAGYEFKNGLLFNMNYSMGLTDVYAYSPEVRKNAYFGVSAGYLFKLKCGRK